MRPPQRPRRERDEELARRLAEFLAGRGTTTDAVLAAVEESLGRPLVVAAAGSILEGFGNSRSDVDLVVVVDQDRLAMASVVSFERELLVDATYFGDAEAKGWVETMRASPWPPAGPLDRAAWRRRATQLLSCTRFAHGLPLRSREGWERWLEELRRPWLAERVREWWRAEAARWSLGARWLARENPLLAAQRHCEAVLAALEARAAAAGRPSLAAKWLPERLRALGDDEGEAAFRAVLRAPAIPDDVPAYAVRCETLLGELAEARDEDPRLAAQLWLAPGVRTRPIGRSTLVSRWDLRGLELDGELPTAAGPPGLVWEGRLDDSLDPLLAGLFVADMTWLSVVAEPA